MTPDRAHSGQIIADLYRLEEPLGRGGMGSIWRAEQLRLRSKVAIKFLDPAISDDPETFSRFVREAQSAAAVRSAHVVQIFDCGVDEGTPYISMELLQGESLYARLRARAVLTPAELERVFTEVCRAVDTAHELGVIHRDLKPGNIFLARERDLEISKVLDFGIAKLMHAVPEVDSSVGTRTGTMLGTPYYMSPEQVRGSRGLDQRADLWSLAIIAFECLTGQLPFHGESMGDVVVRICTSSPPLPSELADVPPGFDEWFAKGTSKDPSGRFQTAREMAERLSEILAGVGTAASQRARGEALTLASVPGPSAADAPLPASSRRTDPAPRRGRTGTAVLSESARVPPSGSTRPLTTLIPTTPGRRERDAGGVLRARWLWVGASVSFVCVAMAVVSRPQSIGRVPAPGMVERGPAASIPAPSIPATMPGRVPAPALRDSPPSHAAGTSQSVADAAAAQPSAEEPAASPVPGGQRSEPSTESVDVLAAGAAPAGAGAREAAPPADELMRGARAPEREPPTDSAGTRRSRPNTSASSRASARASAARAPRTPVGKSAGPAPPPQDAAAPPARSASEPPARAEADPFAERR